MKNVAAFSARDNPGTKVMDPSFQKSDKPKSAKELESQDADSVDHVKQAFIELAVLAPSERENALQELLVTNAPVHARVSNLLANLRDNTSVDDLERFDPILRSQSSQAFPHEDFEKIQLEQLSQLARFTSLCGNSPAVALQNNTFPEGRDGAATDLRYEILAKVAQGGMGTILRAIDRDLGRLVAIKILLPEHRGSTSVTRRFVEEARIGGQLQHPGIAPVYDVGIWNDNCPYFTMKYVNGRTLEEHLNARATTDVDQAKLLGIFEQVCQAVAYAHQHGVIHRDLKPANIMVGEFGEVLVMDWGLAKLVEFRSHYQAHSGSKPNDPTPSVDTSTTDADTVRQSGDTGTIDADDFQTRYGSLLGTPGYMSPEQARGMNDELGPPSDVFALGSILYKILTGAPLYEAEGSFTRIEAARHCRTQPALAQLNMQPCDSALREIVKACVAENPMSRPKDAGALGERIQHYLQSVDERLRESELELERSKARLSEERKRRVFQLAFAATLVVAILSIAAGVLWAEKKQADLDAARARQQVQATQQIREELALAEAYAGLQSNAFPDDTALENAVASLTRIENIAVGQSVAPELKQKLDRLDQFVTGRVREARLIRDLERAYEREMEFRFQQHRDKQEAKLSYDFIWSADLNSGDLREEPPPDSLPVAPFNDPVELFSRAFETWGFSVKDGPEAASQRLSGLDAKNRDFVVACLDRWITLLKADIPFARWQQSHWTNLAAVELKSRGGDDLKSLEDGSILASGENAWAGYELIFDTTETQLSALRLEALLHESLPNHGPGRQEGTGVGTVEGLNVEIAPLGNLDARKKVEFVSAVADYSWPTYPIETDAWHLGFAGGRPHTAVFALRKPMVNEGGFRIWISNRDRFPNTEWSNENLGRFRWSCAASEMLDQRAKLASGLLEIVGMFDKNTWRAQVRAGVNANSLEKVSELGAKLAPEVGSVDSLVQLADWISNIDGPTRAEHLNNSIAWQNPEPINLRSKNGTELRTLDDGSILASGPNPKNEVIELEFPLESDVGAIRFQAIPHEIPASDGRKSRRTWARHESQIKGGVILQDITCELVDAKGSVTPLRLRAIANNQKGEWGLDAKVTDGNEDTYAQLWTKNKELSIFFRPENFPKVESFSDLRLVMRMRTGNGQGNHFRRFRYQLTLDRLSGEQFPSVLAMRLLHNAVDLEPSNYWARISLLSTLFSFEEPDIEACRIHLAAARALAPHRNASNLLALEVKFSDIEQADLAEAVNIAGEAEKLRPNLSDTQSWRLFTDRVDRRIFEIAEQDPGQFRNLSEQIFKLYQDKPRILNWLGIKLARSLPDVAFEFYQRSADIAPQAYVFYNLGSLEAVQRRRPREAEIYFRKALELEPNNSKFLIGLSTVLRRQNKNQEAIGYAELAVKTAPKSEVAQRILGLALSYQGRHREALAAFLAENDLEQSKNGSTLGMIADAYRKINEFQLARDYYLQAIALRSNDVSSITYAAEMAARSGQKDIAFQELNEAIETNPENDWLISVRGKWHAWFGNSAKAKADIESGFEREPSSEYPRRMMMRWKVMHAESPASAQQQLDDIGKLPSLPNAFYWNLIFLKNVPPEILVRIKEWITNNQNTVARADRLGSSPI